MKNNVAKFKKYTISIDEKKAIQVTPMEKFPSTIQAIKYIADKAGFMLDPKWNTQMCGRKLVRFLNIKEEVKVEPNEVVVYENVETND